MASRTTRRFGHHSRRDRSDAYFASRSSLGWSGGAAIGAKFGLARAAGGGAGSYLFSAPPSVHSVAAR
jgi:hypothetical protein